MDIRDRLGMWYDEVKEYLTVKINPKALKDGKEELYETRWVWYHTLLVVELFIIILLLLYIAI
jgi:hypothetical protein|tara:strand:+ start:1013 stop:1201 length:189 start_codon:yes stop_codon:yes gene_type:complete